MTLVTMRHQATSILDLRFVLVGSVSKTRQCECCVGLSHWAGSLVPHGQPKDGQSVTDCFGLGNKCDSAMHTSYYVRSERRNRGYPVSTALRIQESFSHRLSNGCRCRFAFHDITSVWKKYGYWIEVFTS